MPEKLDAIFFKSFTLSFVRGLSSLKCSGSEAIGKVTQAGKVSRGNVLMYSENQRGVGFLVKKSLYSNIIDFRGIFERIVYTVFKYVGEFRMRFFP